uniref:Reverse transcriptase domain-containing protein n=1 Tax=Tanacetum cinerariifolium TaxID=118510 RepID=A0A6L2MZV4_TANCI|nr:reverse transcriptase domain-containing protein [Tanacetum cinerariifolium]
MRTRSSSNLPVESPPNPSTFNPKRRNRRRSKQPFILKEFPEDTMVDQRAARRWIEKEPPRSILTWEDLVLKFINEFFPPSRTTNLRNEILNFQQRFDESFHEQTSNVTTAMKAILKQFQATPPPASVKVVKEICVTCGGAHLYYQCLAASGNTFPELRDNIQGYVATAAVNYNQGNSVYRPLVIRLSELEKVKRMNEANMKAMQTQIDNVKNELRNEMRNSIQASINTIANPKGELKAITTRSGIVLDGPSVPIPLPFINPEEDERLHINITLADALILIPKYQKMLKALLSNKEKLLELANTPLNENCSSVILKKLLEKLGDPRKFLIPCGFNELKCKALADLGASINLMPLSVWKKLGLPKLISTRMTLKLANQAICTPTGFARDVFIPVGKFTFLADFVIVNYESDPRVPLILGRPFLWTTRALIDVYREEMILRDDDEKLTLNMRHDTSSYLNQPQKESINMINIYDDSREDFLEELFTINHQSGNPTFSSHPKLTSPEVKDPEGGNVLPEKLLDLDSTKDLHPPCLKTFEPIREAEVLNFEVLIVGYEHVVMNWCYSWNQSSGSLDFKVLIEEYEHVVMSCGSAGIRFGWSNLQIRKD